MQNLTALEYAERGHFTWMRAFAGDVLYTEGMPGSHMYVIKEGEVDIYMVREEKRVVVERLGKGQCFGMTPHLPKSTRINNAAARSYCELYLIDNATVEAQLEATSELGHSLLQTLSERLSVAHELVATRVNYQPDLLVYAQLLQLLAMAEIGKSTALARHLAPGAQPPSARVLLQDVVNAARLMFGHSDKHISGVLAKLVNLHLVHIEDDGSGKRVQCVPRDLLSQARKVATSGVDQDKSSYEYLSVDEFAGLVEVDRQVLLRKLAGGDFADDVFTFRRAEIIRLLNDKGKRFFAERKVKAPADFSEVADLEFADQKSIFSAVAKVDTYDLAKVLSTVDSAVVKQKLLAALSRSRREEVEGDLADMGPVDPVEVQQLGNGLVREVRELMTAGR